MLQYQHTPQYFKNIYCISVSLWVLLANQQALYLWAKSCLSITSQFANSFPRLVQCWQREKQARLSTNTFGGFSAVTWGPDYSPQTHQFMNRNNTSMYVRLSWWHPYAKQVDLKFPVNKLKALHFFFKYTPIIFCRFPMSLQCVLQKIAQNIRCLNTILEKKAKQYNLGSQKNFVVYILHNETFMGYIFSLFPQISFHQVKLLLPRHTQLCWISLINQALINHAK